MLSSTLRSEKLLSFNNPYCYRFVVVYCFLDLRFIGPAIFELALMLES